MESKKAEQSSKSQILSQLAATRNIIKNKYRHAYSDRMKREQNLSELIKPVTSSFAKEFKINDNKEKVTSEPSPFKPLRLITSTPKGILRNRKRRMKSASKRNITRGSSNDDDGDSFHTVVDDDKTTDEDDNTENSAREKSKFTPSPLNAIPLISKFAPVKSKRLTVGARDINALRRNNSFFYNENIDDNNEPDRRSSLRRSRTQKPYTKEKKGDGIKTHAKLDDDFNFIPYNVNDRIIYEYFNSANQLCDRLRLLISSKMAGNTNHMREISSIIEELRELECID